MKKIFAIVLILAGAAATATAQNSNLNPTIQVTNTFAGHLKQMDRALVPAVVPDSLYHFDLNFEYGGFENPYKGITEFNPYLTELELAPTALLSKKFYLKAGAGYTFHPEMDLAWTLKQKGNFKLGVHALSRAYVGNYLKVNAMDGSNLVPSNDNYKGYDGFARAGIDARVDWEKLHMLVNADWDCVLSENMPADIATYKSFQDAKVDVKLFSNKGTKALNYWGAALSYEYGRDNVCGIATYNASEHSAAANGYFGFNLKNGSSIEVGAQANFATSSAPFNATGSNVILSPRYMFSTGERLDLFAGVSVMAGFGDAEISRFGVFPNVGLTFKAVPSKMDLYLGSSMKSSAENLRSNALLYGFHIDGYNLALPVDMNVNGGMKGSLFGKMTYDLNLFFNRTDNAAVLNQVKLIGEPYSHLIFNHGSITKVGASLALDGKFGGFSFDFNGAYDYFIDTPVKGVTPPAIHLGLTLAYSVLNRFEIHAGSSYVSAYNFETLSTPGYVDLFAGANYRLTEKWGLFIDGHNLLNQSQQIVPLHVRQGFFITAGIVLNF